MQMGWKCALALAASVGAPGLARAHELVCDKTVNGEQQVAFRNFPAKVDWKVRITNVHPTATSVALTASDALITGWTFDPAPPIAIPLGGYVEDHFYSAVMSYQECLEAAALDGVVDSNIDNTFRVTWDLGEAQCTSRITCCTMTENSFCGTPPPPPCEGDECPCDGLPTVVGADGGQECPPPPCEVIPVLQGADGGQDGGEDCPTDLGATRTMGFFKTHESALTQCLAAGPVELGFVTVRSLRDGMGLLWGNVSRFEDRTARNPVEQLRFQLARQALVGVCNQRLFGTRLEPAGALADALKLAASTSCTPEHVAALEARLPLFDAFNNSGDGRSLPFGFVAGPSTPLHAKQLANDPTTPGSLDCNPD